MDLKQTLFDLCNSNFIGDIHTAATLAADLLKAYTNNIHIDSMGNVIATIKGKTDRKIMLQAHIDEVGMVVTNVLDRGFLKVAKVGGVDIRVLPASRVVIHGKEDVKGIFGSTPPHFFSEDGDKYQDLEKQCLDTGLDNAKEIVSVGDYVTYDIKAAELKNDFVTAKSLDDRAACTALIYAAELIVKDGTPDCTVVICLSSGEEIGNRGATTAAYKIDAHEAVAVDVSFGVSPCTPREKCGVCSKGAMVGVSPILNKDVTDALISAAKDKGLEVQYEGMGGETSTDADVISITNSGIPCGLLSIPLRYMHTPVEVVSLSDIENVAEILAAYVKKGGAFNV